MAEEDEREGRTKLVVPLFAASVEERGRKEVGGRDKVGEGGKD